MCVKETHILHFIIGLYDNGLINMIEIQTVTILKTPLHECQVLLKQ